MVTHIALFFVTPLLLTLTWLFSVDAPVVAQNLATNTPCGQSAPEFYPAGEGPAVTNTPLSPCLPTSPLVPPLTTTPLSVQNTLLSPMSGDTCSVDPIPVSSPPSEIVVNPNTNRIYTTHINNGKISVIDGNNNTVLTTISIGNTPLGIAVNAATNRIYVSRIPSGITVINGATNTILTTISTGYTTSLAVDESTNRIYAANPISSTISIINGDDNTVTTISVSNNPYWVALDPDPTNHRLYVLHSSTNMISVVNLDTYAVLTTIPLSQDPHDIGVNTNTKRVYVLQGSLTSANDEVTVINGVTNTVLGSILIGDYTSGLAVNPAANVNRLYVTANTDDELVIIDGQTNTISSTIPVGDVPIGVAVKAATSINPARVYVANYSDSTISVIQDGPCVPSITDGVIAFTSDENGNKDIYVTNEQGNSVGQVTVNPADDYNPSWSPDGKLIAFISTRDNATGDLYITDQLRTHEYRVTSNEGVTSLAWSPDGAYIAYTTSKDGNSNIYAIPIKLDALNIYQGSLSPIQLTANSADDTQMSWSPDERWIVYSRSNDLWKILVWCGKPPCDTQPIQLTADSSKLEKDAAWSPDGKAIAFIRIEAGASSLWLINTANQVQLLVTSSQGTISHPTWSPDGTALVYTSAGGLQKITNISAIVDAMSNGTIPPIAANQTLINSINSAEATWSPYVMCPDASNYKLITDITQNFSVRKACLLEYASLIYFTVYHEARKAVGMNELEALEAEVVATTGVSDPFITAFSNYISQYSQTGIYDPQYLYARSIVNGIKSAIIDNDEPITYFFNYSCTLRIRECENGGSNDLPGIPGGAADLEIFTTIDGLKEIEETTDEGILDIYGNNPAWLSGVTATCHNHQRGKMPEGRETRDVLCVELEFFDQALQERKLTNVNETRWYFEMMPQVFAAVHDTSTDQFDPIYDGINARTANANHGTIIFSTDIVNGEITTGYFAHLDKDYAIQKIECVEPFQPNPNDGFPPRVFNFGNAKQRTSFGLSGDSAHIQYVEVDRLPNGQVTLSGLKWVTAVFTFKEQLPITKPFVTSSTWPVDPAVWVANQNIKFEFVPSGIRPVPTCP